MSNFEEKISYILIDENVNEQQIILNGIPKNLTQITYFGKCSNCDAVLITGQPDIPLKDFDSYLTQLAVNNSLGYCPACGSKIMINLPVVVEDE